MAYNVIVQSAAMDDARDYAGFVRKDKQSPEAAKCWLDRLAETISSLGEMPERFPIIEEQNDFDIQLRKATHYSHRIIFHVNEAEKTVHVLRIYMGQGDR
ncbi:MAG: type II toxin-antitoxin system RelE/ParE family toxin [Fimbriimonadales bacterium]